MTYVPDKSRIFVDTREPPEVHETLDSLGIEYTGQFLDVGDFIIETGSRLLLIERKTRKDLCASIMDGRYYSQKSAMVQAATASEKDATCIYVIEGTDRLSPRYEKMFRGAVSSLVASGLFSVVFSTSIIDTVQIINVLSRKIMREQLIRVPEPPKSARGENPIARLPGIGPKSAREITTCLAGKSLGEILAMSRKDLLGAGVSARTCTALMKAASLVA